MDLKFMLLTACLIVPSMYATDKNQYAKEFYDACLIKFFNKHVNKKYAYTYKDINYFNNHDQLIYQTFGYNKNSAFEYPEVYKACSSWHNTKKTAVALNKDTECYKKLDEAFIIHRTRKDTIKQFYN